jgi:hypothetical protein
MQKPKQKRALAIVQLVSIFDAVVTSFMPRVWLARAVSSYRSIDGLV